MLTYMSSISAEEKVSRKLSAIVKNDTTVFRIHVDNIAAGVNDSRL